MAATKEERRGDGCESDQKDDAGDQGWRAGRFRTDGRRKSARRLGRSRPGGHGRQSAFEDVHMAVGTVADHEGGSILGEIGAPGLPMIPGTVGSVQNPGPDQLTTTGEEVDAVDRGG